MEKEFVKESEEVQRAYQCGTEIGHCSYISYLEKELSKARSAMCEADSNAVLAEVRALITMIKAEDVIIMQSTVLKQKEFENVLDKICEHFS